MVNKYFLKELIPQVLVSICVISAIILITQFYRITRIVTEFGFTLDNIFLPFLFILLPMLATIIPIAYLFAVTITFGRLNSDGELAVFFANGMSVKRMCLPVIWLAGAIYFICLFLGLFVEPWACKQFDAFYQNSAHAQLENIIKTQIQSNTFVDNFLSFKFYAEQVNKNKDQMQNVILTSNQTSSSQQSFVLVAPQASLKGNINTKDLTLHFSEGSVYFFSDFAYKYLKDAKVQPIHRTPLQTPYAQILRFKTLELNLVKIFKDSLISSQSKIDAENLYPLALIQYIKDTESNLESTDPRVRKTYYEARYLLHQRIALPLLVFIFGMMALVLSIQDTRKTRNTSYPASLLTLVVSYCIIMSCKSLAIKGTIHPVIALWLPLILLFIFARFVLGYKQILAISTSLISKEGLRLLNKEFNSRHLPKLVRLKSMFNLRRKTSNPNKQESDTKKDK